MTTSGWARLDTALRSVTLCSAACFAVLYLVLAAVRMGYPFELEWMEGGALGQVSWILSGHKLYGPPSLEFTPWVYPPFYFYVSAAVSSMLGGGLLPLRLVSFAASLGSLAIIFAIVRRETGSRRAGWLSAGLFVATYQLGGTWFDLARIDSLFLVLSLAALYVLRFTESSRAALLAGVLLSLSFFSKQTALVVATPVALYLVAVDGRRGLVFIATVTACVVGGTLLLDHWQDGWFTYYVFTVPGRLSSRLVKERVVYFWTRDIIMPLAVACGLAVFSFVAVEGGWRRRGLFYVAMAIGMFAGAWIPRIQSGGYQNTVIPAYAAVSVLFGLGWHRVGCLTVKSDQVLRAQFGVVVNLLVVMQFAALVYNPLATVPKAGDRDAGTRIVDRLRLVDGRVLVFAHPYLASMAGKPPTAHAVGLLDILGWGDERDKAALRSEIRTAVASRKFAAIVLDDRSDEVFRGAMGDYDDAGLLLDDPKAFWPVTGFRVRPTRLYLLRPPVR